MISKSIEKYIDEEIEISRYKISSLSRVSNLKPSQKRILEIEEELCSTPFKSLGFSSTSEAATAFRIFRESRAMFYDMYLNESRGPTLSVGSAKELCQCIDRKLHFLNSKAKELSSFRPQEVNLVQDKDSRDLFFRHLADKNSSPIGLEVDKFRNKKVKDYEAYEPSVISKFRARKQACIMSAGRHMHDECQRLSSEYRHELLSKNISKERLTTIEGSIDSVFFNLNDNIYKNYNYAIDSMHGLIEKTMGSNKSFRKIRRLKNCLESSDGIPNTINSSNGKTSFRIENIFCGSKEPIKHSFLKDKNKNISTKAYGILFPIKRIGNEKMTPLYIDIWTDSDVCMNNIICNKLSNVKATDPVSSDDIYYKCIFLLPMWKVLEASFLDDGIKMFLSKIYNLDIEKFNDIDFNDKKNISKELSFSEGFANINDSKSSILVPSTRSEEFFFSTNREKIQNHIINVSGYNEYVENYTINNRAVNV